MGKGRCKIVFSVVGTDKAEVSYKDSVRDASGGVLKGPEMFYNAETGSSVGTKNDC